jgi:hypothetical protein
VIHEGLPWRFLRLLVDDVQKVRCIIVALLNTAVLLRPATHRYSVCQLLVADVGGRPDMSTAAPDAGLLPSWCTVQCWADMRGALVSRALRKCSRYDAKGAANYKRPAGCFAFMASIASAVADAATARLQRRSSRGNAGQEGQPGLQAPMHDAADHQPHFCAWCAGFVTTCCTHEEIFWGIWCAFWPISLDAAVRLNMASLLEYGR